MHRVSFIYLNAATAGKHRELQPSSSSIKFIAASISKFKQYGYLKFAELFPYIWQLVFYSFVADMFLTLKSLVTIY